MKYPKILAGVVFAGAACLLSCSSGGGSSGSGGAAGQTTTGGAGGSGSGGTSVQGGAGGNGTGGTSTKGSGGNGTGGAGSGGNGTGGTSAKGSGGNGTGGAGSGGSATGGTSAKGGAGGTTTGPQGTGGPGICTNCVSTGGTVPGTGGLGTGGSGAGGLGTGGAATGGSTGGLPPLQVNGTKLQDPNGKTIVLRGSSLIDIGALYAYNGNSGKGISDRMDKLAAAGVQGHVVRFPVYPKIDYNGGYPYCSDLPYPVGTGPGTSCTAKSPMTAADYVAKVLKPAVDYATGKNLYVIIDHHQIDDLGTGSAPSASAKDANTFWTDVAPKFASYGNVLYEPFNEPISGSSTWAQIKPVVQGFVDTIRSGGASNVIIVPSNSYCQRPGDAASDPPTDPKQNLMFTAHVYPGNWNATFKQQVATAVGKAPVFFTEWGYILNGGDATLGTSSATWGSDFRALVDGNGASWTAWVTDNGWTPNIFSDSAFTQLTDFGTLVKTWLAAKAGSDWVQ
jgi:endoglucanase